jgi:hypothetical protein
MCYIPYMQTLLNIWSFLRIRKKWWLLPMLTIIAFLGAILAFAQASPLAPFIYTLI